MSSNKMLPSPTASHRSARVRSSVFVRASSTSSLWQR